jgi:hypothetical protein
MSLVLATTHCLTEISHKFLQQMLDAGDGILGLTIPLTITSIINLHIFEESQEQNV